MHKCPSINLQKFLPLFCEHFENYFSLLTKNMSDSKAPGNIRAALIPGMKYAGHTGFYIKASKAICGRNEACEPSGWNIAVHVVRLCSSLKKLTVAATHIFQHLENLGGRLPKFSFLQVPLELFLREYPRWGGGGIFATSLFPHVLSWQKLPLMFCRLVCFSQIWTTSPLGSRLTSSRWTCLGTASNTWSLNSSWCPKT